MGGSSKVKGRRRSKRGSTRGDRKGLKELVKETKETEPGRSGRRKSSDKGKLLGSGSGSGSGTGTGSGTGSASASGSGDASTRYSVQQLLDQATECMDSFNYELAQKFLQRALEMEPDNLQVLEVTGNLLMDVGELDRAKQHCFGRAISLSPELGHGKYMYMGQLYEGQEACQFFQKGLELMRRQRQRQEKQPEGASAEGGMDVNHVTDGDIARAYCSLAELYLTDSCFVTDAEERCKQCIDKAIAADGDSAEAYQILSSYWLSKDDKEEAKQAIEKSLSLWLPKMKALEEEEVNTDLMTFDPVHTCPLNYQNRIGTAKILMELEMNEQAEEILEGLLQEDDQVVQVWYMLGLMNVEKTGQDHNAPARYFLSMAKKLYHKVRCDDEQVLQHTEELLTQLGPGEGLDESWPKSKGESSDSEDTEEDELSSEGEGEEAKAMGNGTAQDEKMEH